MPTAVGQVSHRNQPMSILTLMRVNIMGDGLEAGKPGICSVREPGDGEETVEVFPGQVTRISRTGEDLCDLLEQPFRQILAVENEGHGMALAAEAELRHGVERIANRPH